MTIDRTVRRVARTVAIACFAAVAVSACATDNTTPAAATDNKVIDDAKKDLEPVLLKVGDVCKGDGECASGKCENAACAAGKLLLDAVCKGNGECESGVCFSGNCKAACTAQKDCAAGALCMSDNGLRTFCTVPTFAKELGVSCAGTGKCPGGLECSHPAEAIEAVCTAACNSDIDCPTELGCLDRGDGNKRCLKRAFCDTCVFDEQCGAGKRCVQMGAVKACSRDCIIGRTECPRFAECTAMADGSNACIHRAGSCTVKVPKLCSPCMGDKTCASGAKCLNWPSTQERFCGQSCSSKTDKSCGSGYKCYEIGQGKFQCAPLIANKMLTCQSKISPRYEKGDIMEDYGMVGVVDFDGDGSLTDETPRVLRLSHFEAHKIIFLTSAAGWCSACKQETLDFKNIYNKYGGNLVIFQVLFQGFTQKSNDYATFKVLNTWNSQLKPIGGAVGVDYTRRISTFNTAGSTPMNMLIDAKTRLILDKWNGYSHGSLVNKLNALPHLKN